MNLARLTDRLNAYLRGFSYGEEVQPVRDWLLIISAGLVLLLICTGWSYWIFKQASSTEETAASATTATMGISTFETVRNIFEKRAADQAHYLSDYHFVDPSQ